jgi:hypothetical protein
VGLAKVAAAAAETAFLPAAPNPTKVFEDNANLITPRELEEGLDAIKEIQLALKASRVPDTKSVSKYKEIETKVRQGLTDGLRQQVEALDLALPYRKSGEVIPPKEQRCIQDRSILDKEQTAIDTFNYLLELDTFNQMINEAGAPPVKRTLRTLRKDVDREIERASTLDPPKRTRELDAALTRYRNTVNLVLHADEKLSGRALGQQRKVLEAFLQSSIPKGPKGTRDTNTKSYETIRSELTKVDAALAALLSEPVPPDEPLTLATEVTRRIDDRVYFDRCSQAPEAQEMDRRQKLARARIRSGNYNAVVIGYPAGK